jgi:class 3 adenylate cyclase
MGKLSKSSEIAIQIAEYEAVRSRHKSIEPEHFLLGILSLEKVFDAGAQSQFQLNPDAVDSVRIEFEPLQSFLRAKGVNPPLMRRSLRELLRKYVSPKLDHAGTVPRPSAKIQDLCVRAAVVTDAMNSPEIRIEHFLIALIEDQTSEIPGLLRELSLRPEELAAEVRSLRTSRQATHAIRVVNATDSTLPEVPLRDVSLQKTEILEAVDATRSMQMAPPSTKASASRFTLLCELPSQIEKETRIEPILHRFLTGLIEAIPAATGGAVLMKGRNEEELLLKAHVSQDEPAVNLAAACQAMETRQGFISRLETDSDPEEPAFSTYAPMVMYAPMVWKGEVLGVMCVDGADPRHSFESDDLKILVAVAQHACLIINDLQMQEDLKRNAALLERLLTNFSPKVRSRLLDRARRGRLQLGGERSEVTLLFSDIRNFTNLSAGMDTEDVLEMLNQCFSVSADSIFKFDGTIDKFIGDAVLAVFGSPDPDPQQHSNALRAALKMQESMAQLNRQRTARGQKTCEIGIGIHCGEVLHGFVGATELMEFTVIGDVVNRASRYCSAAKAGEVLISPELYQRVWQRVEASQTTIQTKHEGPLLAYRVKGLKEQVKRYA